MSKEEVDIILSEMEWVVAKSYPTSPHQYSRIKDIKTTRVKEAWLGVISHIWNHSKLEYWKYGKSFPYYRANGFKYWVMDKTIESTDLINRSKI